MNFIVIHIDTVAPARPLLTTSPSAELKWGAVSVSGKQGFLHFQD